MKKTKNGKPWFLLFCDIFDFLSLKNDENVASKSNKQKDYFVDADGNNNDILYRLQ
jgi:hypothetical protein